MWMLVRGTVDKAETVSEDDISEATLVACPDTADRGDPWRWAVRRVQDTNARDIPPYTREIDRESRLVRGPADWHLEVSHDPRHVRATSEVHSSGTAIDVLRPSGAEIVVVPVVGRALVSSGAGAWRRWLAPGDVFVVEGEDDEALRLTPEPGPSCLAVVELVPTSDQPLRWVP